MMPLNETDRAWIREAIRESHSQQRPSRVGRLARFVKEWSGTSAAVAVLLFGATQWTAYVEFRTKTNDTINELKDKLGTLTGQLAKQNVVYQASLPAASFSSSLNELSRSITVAKAEQVTVPEETLHTVRQKLVQTDDSSPGYWALASQLVSYEIAAPDLKPCGQGRAVITLGDHFLPDMPASGRLEWENCTLKLDDVFADVKPYLNPALREGLVLHNVHVVYHGSPLPRVAYIACTRCTFELQIDARPSTEAQSITRQLLASTDPANASVRVTSS